MKLKTILPVFFVVFIFKTGIAIFEGHIPPMETFYLDTGMKLIGLEKSEVRLSPAYSLYIAVLVKSGLSLKNTAILTYSIFSAVFCTAFFVMLSKNFSKKSGYIGLVFCLISSNLNPAICGFSNTVLVALAFMILSIIFFLDFLHNPSKSGSILWIFLFCFLAIETRPENILFLGNISFIASIFLIYHLKFSQNPDEKKIYKNNIMLVLSGTIFTLTLLLIQRDLLKKLSTYPERTGVFTDKKYSYLTYMHTLCLMDRKEIEDDYALTSSTRIFGSPESNDWSIARAIKSNPTNALKFSLFNLKALLTSMSNPLLMNFMVLFIGGIILVNENKKTVVNFTVLVLLILPSILSMLIFHVEIRYMCPIMIPLVTAFSVSTEQLLNRKIYFPLFVIALEAVISFYYLIFFRSLTGRG